MTATFDRNDGRPRTAWPGAEDQRPAKVVDIELSQPLPAITTTAVDGRPYREVWAIVRVFEEPVGLVPVSTDGPVLSTAALSAAVERECGGVVRARARAAGADPVRMLSGLGDGSASTPGFLAGHARAAATGPQITVVVCTRGRPDDLARALRSLADQSYPRFDVLVVDNAPADGRTALLVAGLGPDGPPVAYTVERRPGLSWARNHALAQVTSPVVAWLDDDEVADRHWLSEIAAAFAEAPDAAAVSGSVVPAELETLPQLWFEQYGGHTKGRGFVGAVFRGHDGAGRSPLYPLPVFGVGANMAFRVDELRRLGGFDTALGAGTLTRSGEDTLVFAQILVSGGVVVYRPSALTRHFHRPDYRSLELQMTGYGTGLTAYYTSLLAHDWRLIGPLLRLLPTAAKDTFGGGGERLSRVPDTFPRELLRRKARGMIVGPFAYMRARRAARALEGAAQ